MRRLDERRVLKAVLTAQALKRRAPDAVVEFLGSHAQRRRRVRSQLRAQFAAFAYGAANVLR